MELESETFTPPLDIYCSELRARHIRRTYASDVGDYIKGQCRMIASRLRRRDPRRRPVPQIVPVIQEKISWAEERERAFGGEGKKAVLIEWRQRWEQENRQRRRRWCSIAATEEPSAGRLKLHDHLRKAESSVLVQARTGRIGLAHFLNKARVPGFPAPGCECEQGDETAEHVLLHCRLESERRSWQRGASFRDLVSEERNTRHAAKWLIQSGRLGQFRLANRLLYT
jgi:hypothetical protein